MLQLAKLEAERDVIDQAGSPWIIGRKPRYSRACHVLLQTLQQRHEVPNGEDVILHEPPEIGDRSDLRIQGMVKQRRPEAAEMVVVICR